MTVMLTGTSPNAELYSRALSNAYRWYYRLIDPDWSIEQDPEIWIKKAWRDPVLAQAMQTRMHMVAGREWQIQPGRKNPSPEDTRAADVVADAFSRIAKFSEARALLATSVLRGSAYAFTEGTRETVTLGGLRGKWWTPRKLRNISKQRFIYTPETITHEDGRQSIEVQQRFYPLMDPWPVVVPPEFAERIIKVVYLDEEDRLTGIGGRPLLESVYFLFWAKSEVMKTGLQTLEKWAGGMLIAKTDLNAQPGELGRDSDSVRNEMLTMLESMRGRHVGCIDKEDELQHIDGGAGGSGAAFLEFLRYMDEKIVGLLLGSVLPFGQSGDSAGSYARAVEERAVSDLILDFDKQNISEAITDTVIRLFWKNNRPQIAAAGLADAAMPQFAILPERRDDFAANAQILSQAINSGMPIKAAEAYEKLGLTQPTQEEIDAGDVIEKEEPAPGGFPFRESPGAKFGAGRPRKFAASKSGAQAALDKILDDFGLWAGENPTRHINDLHEDAIDNIADEMIAGGHIDAESYERQKTDELDQMIRGAIEKNNAATGYTETPDRWMLEVAQEINERIEYDDPEGAIEGMAELDRLAEKYPDAVADAMAVKDIAYPEGGGGRMGLKKSLQAAEKSLGVGSATLAASSLASAERDLRIQKGYGYGDDSSRVQEAQRRVDKAKEKMDSMSSAKRTPAADKPSGKRKRCPDGEHKDEDGQCRPVT